MTKRVIALGTFDGVHLGHRQIINKMLEIANISGPEPLIYTFSNHPLKAFGRAPKLIMSDEDRIGLLGRFAPVEAVPFDIEYASISPEQFAEQLVTKYNAAVAVAGFNYTFGAKGAGNMDMLRKLGEKLGFDVVEVPPFVQAGMPVSSSRIRVCVENGDIEQANAMLGRSFGFCATAEQSGRTVRLKLDEAQVYPLSGSYSAVTEESTQGTIEVKGGEMLLSSDAVVYAGSKIHLCLKHKII